MPLQLQWSARHGRNGDIWWTQTPFGKITIGRRLYLHHYVWWIDFPDGGINRQDDLNKAKTYAEAWMERKTSNPSSPPA